MTTTTKVKTAREKLHEMALSAANDLVRLALGQMLPEKASVVAILLREAVRADAVEVLASSTPSAEDSALGTAIRINREMSDVNRDILTYTRELLATIEALRARTTALGLSNAVLAAEDAARQDVFPSPDPKDPFEVDAHAWLESMTDVRRHDAVNCRTLGARLSWEANKNYKLGYDDKTKHVARDVQLAYDGGQHGALELAMQRCEAIAQVRLKMSRGTTAVFADEGASEGASECAAAVRVLLKASPFAMDKDLCVTTDPSPVKTHGAFVGISAPEALRNEVKPPRRSAVSLIEDKHGRVLCVWNRRYEGWSLPGGMVEPGESVENAQRRELTEETGLATYYASLVFQGAHYTKPKIEEREGRGTMVHVFRVDAVGEPREMEAGCPVCWLTRSDFVERSPFGDFYEEVFSKLPSKNPVNIVIDPAPGDFCGGSRTVEGSTGTLLKCPGCRACS